MAALAAAAVALGCLPASSAAAGADLTSLVHPLSGTLGSGFPTVGATRPFGMVQLGPDTGLANGAEDPVNYTGYAFQDPTIRGFSLTHFDGAGIKIAGDLPFMPTTGDVSTDDPATNASAYSHADEQATPGYYAVTLSRYSTRVELTAAQRSGMLRATFPSTSQANLIVNPATSLDGSHPGGLSVVGDRELRGWARSGVGYSVYFTAIFDRPFASFGTWQSGARKPGARDGEGGWVTFDTSSSRSVNMRVGISYVDQHGADSNLAAELPPSTTFADALHAAHDDWNAHLHAVDTSGGDPGLRDTFYTNLYRTLLMPSLIDDADGRYPGFDKQVHTVRAGSHHYTNLSLWDTYRTQSPLLGLIEPGVQHDVAMSLLDDYAQSGSIPRWVQADRDRGIMGGDSGTPVVADAVTEGLLRGGEASAAYAAMLHQADTLPPAWPREFLGSYLARGYIGYDETDRGAAQTQEYAIDDAALSQVARLQGTPGDVQALTARAGNWRNLLDPSSKYIRPRNKDGSWANPTAAGPLAVPWSPNFQDGYQEGTGWQYLWAEPHDVGGLANAIGGRDEALRRLDTFFSTPLNDPTVTAVPTAQQYASVFGVYYIGDQFTPANEPDLWTPWYYDWLGQPWKAQRVARAEMSVYNSRPDGLPGNDDAGTMSAWYVLAALGLYHAAPGFPVWELSSPAFDHAAIHSGRRTFALDAPGSSSTSPYVQSATLGGAPFARTYLTSCELRRGGRLSLSLGAQPNQSWATDAAAAPPSLSDPASMPACG